MLSENFTTGPVWFLLHHAMIARRIRRGNRKAIRYKLTSCGDVVLNHFSLGVASGSIPRSYFIRLDVSLRVQQAGRQLPNRVGEGVK